MKKLFIGVLSVMVMMLVLTACNDNKKVQRAWIKADTVQGNPKEEPVMIFSKGNEFEFRMSNAVYAKGHYEIKDDNKVKMDSDIKSMNGNFDELKGKFNEDFSKFELENGEEFEPYKGDSEDIQ